MNALIVYTQYKLSLFKKVSKKYLYPVLYWLFVFLFTTRRFAKKALKFVLPRFLFGTPNIFSNIHELATNQNFQPLRMAIGSTLILTLILGATGFQFALDSREAYAASFDWVQTSWSGGLDGGVSLPNNTSNKTGWTKFSATSTVDLSTPTEVKISNGSGSFTDTFTDTTYKDNSSTTATWGSDNITITDANAISYSTTLNTLWSGANVTALEYATTSRKVYLGGQYGKFAVFDVNTHAFTDLTTTLGWSLLSTQGVNVIKAVGNKIYVGGDGTKFAVYTEGGSVNDLSSTITNSVFSMEYDSVHNKIFLGGPAKLFEYDPVLSTTTNRTSSLSAVGWVNNINAMSYDPATQKIYLGGGGGKFGFYNTNTAATTDLTTSSGLSGTTWASANANAILFDSVSNKVYLGADVGRFAIYDIGTNTASDPGNTTISSPGSTSYLRSFAMNTTTNILYIFGGSPKLLQYYVSSGVATEKTTKLSSWVGTNKGRWIEYDPDNYTMYLAGEAANFHEYATPYKIAQSTTTASTTVKYATLTANDTTNSSSTVTYYLSNNGGVTWNQVTKGSEYTFSSAGTDLRWKAILTNTASIQDVTIAYRGYQSEATLISSAFDSESTENIVTKLRWTESLATNTDVKFQVRTAPDNGGVPGTWTQFMGPASTTADYFTSPTGSESMPSVLRTGNNDRWVQYKAYLTSTDAVSTPTLSDVTLTYVVNSPPDFDPSTPATASQGTTTQATSNFVTITYSARDEDGDTGTIYPLHASTTFAYTENIDAPVPTWTTISVSDMSTGARDITLATSTYTDFTATWRATSTSASIYSTRAAIKVTVNDNEAANNTVSSTTAAFTLDTKKPTWGGTPLSVDASAIPADVTISCADDSSMQMRIGLTPSLSDATWVTYNSAATLSVTSEATVYAQCRDIYGNENAIQDITLPATPSSMFFQDVSDSGNSDWRLFVAWSLISEPAGGFNQYNIYRSTDGNDYELINTVSSRTSNYFIDSGLSNTSEYKYKVTAQDDQGNISQFSDETDADVPNGSGGTDITPPTLTTPAIADITPTGVTITWETTNELSNSTVYYIATTTYPGSATSDYESSQGVASMVQDHSVTLSGLTPNTQYYFMIVSTDPSNNTGENSVDSSAYYFTTAPGPVISGVTTPSIYDEEVTIVWQTDTPANSTIVYSTSAVLAEPTTLEGSTELVEDHQVTIDGLTPGQRYYYYVKSEDAGTNESVDKNVVDGTIEYYTFVTTQDTVDPVISAVDTALVGETGATITWDTDEGTLSKVQWGETTDLEFGESEETTTYSNSQAIILDGLDNETTYYYMVISTDRSGNQSTDDNAGARYSFTTLAPTVIHSTTTVVVNNGGGGGGSSGKDTTAPSITNLAVRNLAANSVTIDFTTSEPANQRIQYGPTTLYGRDTASLGTYTTSHAFRLSGLSANTEYHYKVYVKDVAGNEGNTGDKTFKTLATNQAPVPNQTPTPETPVDLSQLSPEESELLASVEGASNLLLQKIIDSMFKNKNLTPEDVASSVAEAAESVISSPTISGVDIVVDAGPRSATIKWATNKESNSLIAFAPVDEYKAGTESPYIQTVGDPDAAVKIHEVKLENLQPNTTYHYQTRSQGKLGPVTASEDRTFTTPGLSAEVTDVTFASIKEDEATLKWKTSLPTQSTIEVTDARTGKRTEQEDPSFVKEHEFVLEDLSPSSNYTVKVISKDEEGNSGESNLIPLSTVLNKNPVVISDVRVTTSLIPGKVEKVQSIVTWKTDKPSTSRVYYEEGVSSNADLAFSTDADDTFTTEHIVITTAFKPGKVYRFRVESIDGYDNKTFSKDFTILTPRPKETVVDVIIKNFEQTFGFLKSGQ